MSGHYLKTVSVCNISEIFEGRSIIYSAAQMRLDCVDTYLKIDRCNVDRYSLRHSAVNPSDTSAFDRR